MATGGSHACSAPNAAKLAYYTRIRKDDQIVDGILRYEKERRRSLEFTQQSTASWMNIAVMQEKMGLRGADGLWMHGLGDGHSFKARAAPMACCLPLRVDLCVSM